MYGPEKYAADARRALAAAREEMADIVERCRNRQPLDAAEVMRLTLARERGDYGGIAQAIPRAVFCRAVMRGLTDA